MKKIYNSIFTIKMHVARILKNKYDIYFSLSSNWKSHFAGICRDIKNKMNKNDKCLNIAFV